MQACGAVRPVRPYRAVEVLQSRRRPSQRLLWSEIDSFRDQQMPQWTSSASNGLAAGRSCSYDSLRLPQANHYQSTPQLSPQQSRIDYIDWNCVQDFEELPGAPRIDTSSHDADQHSLVVDGIPHPESPITLQKADQTRRFSQSSLIPGHSLSCLVSGCTVVDEPILSATPPPHRPGVIPYRIRESSIPNPDLNAVLTRVPIATSIPTSSFQNITDIPKAVYHPSSLRYSASVNLPAKVFSIYVRRW